MTHLSDTCPASRREAFKLAVLAGCADAHAHADRGAQQVAAMALQVKLAALGMMTSAYLAVGSNVAYAASEGGCKSKSADTMLKFVNLLADMLIGIGSGVSILMFSIGAIFIIFGGNQRKVSKGMEIIRQTVVGLAILAAGVFIRTIIVSFVFNGNTRARTSC